MTDWTGLATQAGDVKYGSQLSALQRALAEAQRQNTQDIDATNIYGTKGPSAIGGAYDALDTSLSDNRTAVNSQLTGIANNIGQGYKDASSVLQGRPLQAPTTGATNFNETQNALDRMLFNNETLSARATGDMQAWAGQMDSINAKGQDISKNMRADSLGRFQTELLDSLSNLRLEGAKTTNEYNGQMQDVYNERGNFIATEMARLAAEEWQRQLAQAQLQQEYDLAMAQIAAQDRATAASSAGSASDDSLEWAKFKYLQEQDALDRGTAAQEYADTQASKNNYDPSTRASILGSLNEMMAGGASYNQIRGYADSVRGTDPSFGSTLDGMVNTYGTNLGTQAGRALGSTYLDKIVKKSSPGASSSGGGLGGAADRLITGLNPKNANQKELVQRNGKWYYE